MHETIGKKKGEPILALPTIRVHLQITICHLNLGGHTPYRFFNKTLQLS